MTDCNKNKENDIEFGNYIKELRFKQGLTLMQVAERLDVSINYVSQLERGLRTATNKLISEFARIYHVDEDELYRVAGKIPLSTLEEMRKSPSLQKAFSYLKKTKVSEEKRKKLEQELLGVFAEFLNVHKEDILDGTSHKQDLDKFNQPEKKYRGK